MKSRISRRKKLGTTKMQILLTILLMLVVSGINFDVIPNINTYINTHELKKIKKPKVKFLNKNHIRLETPEAANVRVFSEQVNSDAVFVAQNLKQTGGKIANIEIKQKNNLAFDQYGYSMPQFRQLVLERYEGKQPQPVHRVILAEHLLSFLRIIIDCGSLLGLIGLIIYFRKKKR